MKTRRFAATVLLTLLVSVSILPAISNASGSMYLTTLPSDLKVGDYVNYSYKEYSTAIGGITINQSYQYTEVVAINHSNDSLEFFTKTNLSSFEPRKSYYSNTSFADISNALPLYNTSFLSSANLSTLQNGPGIFVLVAFEKNVTFKLDSKYYKTFYMRYTLNVSFLGSNSSYSPNTNMSMYIDGESGLLLSDNLSEYWGPGTGPPGVISGQVIYVSATSIPTTASNFSNPFLKSLTSVIFSPATMMFIGLVVLIAVIFVYDLRRK